MKRLFALVFLVTQQFGFFCLPAAAEDPPPPGVPQIHVSPRVPVTDELIDSLAHYGSIPGSFDRSGDGSGQNLQDPKAENNSKKRENTGLQGIGP